MATELVGSSHYSWLLMPVFCGSNRSLLAGLFVAADPLLGQLLHCFLPSKISFNNDFKDEKQTRPSPLLLLRFYDVACYMSAQKSYI